MLSAFACPNFLRSPLQYGASPLCKVGAKKRVRAKTQWTMCDNSVPITRLVKRATHEPSPQSTGAREPDQIPIPEHTVETEDEAKKFMQQVLSSRVDVLVCGGGGTERISASLQALPRRFNALILSPTRLSAMSIVAELGEYVGSSRVIAVVGRGPHGLSDPARTAMKQTKVSKGAVLVATPRALCESFFKTGNGPKWLGLVDRFILDDIATIETLGATKQVHRIMKFLRSRRQTLAFLSLQNPQSVTLLHRLLRPNFLTFRWPGGDSLLPRARAARIPQRYAVTTVEVALSALLTALEDARRVPNHKVLMFLRSAKLVQFYAALFRAMDIPIEELHSRRSPASQMHVLTMFAEADYAVLLTSDMCADRLSNLRVTHVLQVGAPGGATPYENRVALATAELGSALLLLVDYERDIVLKSIDSSTRGVTEASCYSDLKVDEKLVKWAHESMECVPWQFAAAAYMSIIGVYSPMRRTLGWTKADLVQRAVEWGRLTTGQGPWAVSQSFVKRLNLWDVPGLLVEDDLNEKLSHTRNAGMLAWDRSLEGKLEPGVGKRGKNVRHKRLKQKRPKIKNWREILKNVKETEASTIAKLNRKSPEGRKYMALIASRAVARDLHETAQRNKKLKMEQEELEKKKREEREKLRIENWGSKEFKKTTWYNNGR